MTDLMRVRPRNRDDAGNPTEVAATPYESAILDAAYAHVGRSVREYCAAHGINASDFVWPSPEYTRVAGESVRDSRATA